MHVTNAASVNRPMARDRLEVAHLGPTLGVGLSGQRVHTAFTEPWVHSQLLRPSVPENETSLAMGTAHISRTETQTRVT